MSARVPAHRKKRAEQAAKEDLSGTVYDADPVAAARAVDKALLEEAEHLRRKAAERLRGAGALPASGFWLAPDDEAMAGALRALVSRGLAQAEAGPAEAQACFQLTVAGLQYIEGETQPKGVAVSDTATAESGAKAADAPKQEEEPTQSVDDLRAVMAKHQKGYDAYCKLRAEIKEASSKSAKEELAAKQERHKPAFKAWKKAYNAILKQGVSLRDLKKLEKAEAAPAEAEKEEAAA